MTPGLRSRLADVARRIVALSAALLAALLVARAAEAYLLAETGRWPEEAGRVALWALGLDLAFFLRLLPVLLVPCLAALLRPRPEAALPWFFGATATAVLAGEAALAQFFATAGFPLGADLFGYSLRDIGQTVEAGAEIDDRTALLFLLPILTLWAALPRLDGRRAPPWAAAAALAAGLLAFAVPATPSPSAFRTEYAQTAATNKAAYFTGDSVRFFARRWLGAGAAAASDPPRDAGIGTAVGEAAFRYLDPAYPFLRADSTPDVLGPFLEIDPARPPNLVFVLVEGLGRAFSGRDAYLGSFTPFLDSLADRSLTWENFLASQGRTFALLSSLFSSLPYGEQGFLALGERMPPHHSLVGVLKAQGYRTRFYGGFDLDFDGERTFLRRQGFDLLVGRDEFGPGYTRAPGALSWGYPDGEVVRRALEQEASETHEPFVAIIQTMSTHTPYQVPDQAAWRRRFEERMEALSLPERTRGRRRANADVYATILYMDDSLRRLFEGFEDLPGYKNTIFIVTGDHRLPEIPLSTRIDRYHVPFILFSPLLKRPERIRSVSTHHDVAPSLFALLRARCGIRTPSAVPWVGAGLDVEPSFRNVHAVPLKQTIGNLVHFVSGLRFLDQGVLFDLRDGMRIEPIDDPEGLRRVTAEFDDWRARNDVFARNLRLLPESVYAEFPDGSKARVSHP